MKRILIVSELNLCKTFIIPTILKLKQDADLQFDCLIVTKISPSEVSELKPFFINIYYNKFPKGFISRIPKLRFVQFIYGLKNLVKGLSDYEIGHIHYHHYYYALISPIIRKKVRKFYITFYGSDFNDMKWYMHLGNKKTIALSDGIFVTENPDFLDKIVRKYKIENTNRKTGILFPLMKAFESFEKEVINSSAENAKRFLGIHSKHLLVCGYNAAPIVQHEKMIEVLINIKESLTEYTVIFPMTYGGMTNITRSKVKNLLKTSCLNYRVIEDYLSIEEVLALRLASDIFIHIQTRDQMASSMLEHLAAGSVVITGKWLPYEFLIEMGVYFIQIDKVEDLKETLMSVLENLSAHMELCRNNRSIILDLTSWEKNRRTWDYAYDLI